MGREPTTSRSQVTTLSSKSAPTSLLSSVGAAFKGTFPPITRPNRSPAGNSGETVQGQG
jgi:hypothetical protein